MSARVCVVGAGVIGLAIAQELSAKGYEVYVLEASGRIAEGVTSRNSGVIHASLYYPEGSLKAALCRKGMQLLYEWCERAGVPHRRAGKLVIAANEAQLPALDAIRKNAHNAGATEVEFVSGHTAGELEPHVRCVGALYSPLTGIVDPYELSVSFLRAAESSGATLVLNAKVEGAARKRGNTTLQTSVGPIETDWVINAAGLESDHVAEMGGDRTHTIYPWRGDYFSFRPGRSFKRLVYPCKDPRDPGLGVHLTLDLAGNARLGPDVEYVESRTAFGPREDKLATFLTAAQRMFPWATADMLSYDTCGIRPKLRAPNANSDPDFVIARDGVGWINLIGIESPGLTSSMAISQRVLELITE